MSVRRRTWVTGCGESREAWVVAYTDRNGSRRIATFERKKDAEAYEAQVKTEIRAGIHSAASVSPTVAEAAENWLTWDRARGPRARNSADLPTARWAAHRSPAWARTARQAQVARRRAYHSARPLRDQHPAGMEARLPKRRARSRLPDRQGPDRPPQEHRPERVDSGTARRGRGDLETVGPSTPACTRCGTSMRHGASTGNRMAASSCRPKWCRNEWGTPRSS